MYTKVSSAWSPVGCSTRGEGFPLPGLPQQEVEDKEWACVEKAEISVILVHLML